MYLSLSMISPEHDCGELVQILPGVVIHTLLGAVPHLLLGLLQLHRLSLTIKLSTNVFINSLADLSLNSWSVGMILKPLFMDNYLTIFSNIFMLHRWHSHSHLNICMGKNFKDFSVKGKVVRQEYFFFFCNITLKFCYQNL